MRIVERGRWVEVDNDDSSDYWCMVWSRTHRKVYYDVHNTKDGWTCRCESYRLGHKVCKHMVAAFILAASGSRQSKKKAGASFEAAGEVVQALRIHGRGMEREPSAEADIHPGGGGREPLYLQRVRPQVCRQARL